MLGPLLVEWVDLVGQLLPRRFGALARLVERKGAGAA